MFDLLWGIVNFLFGFWKRLPESLKKEIIEFTVLTFQEVFREYYKNHKSRWSNENE